MKKSIFIGALALITLAACQNETTDVPTNSTVTMEKAMARESWEKPSQNPYELDGYLHIEKNTLRTVYMGVEFIPVDNKTEIFNMVTSAVNSKNSSTSRIVANVKCSVQEGNMNIAVVDVCNSGNCTLFTVYTFDNGEQYAYQQPGSHNYAIQCAMAYLHSWL
ncbi:hypothetical protein [Chryseobacterium indologenes]|uniref:hypothetical protein n=1 Tax=Chryseobacterium indologenes TaxID=253 RepID=UPI0009A1CD2D|nr:hypothetical protein [Chryseobacterium indologenes]